MATKISNWSSVAADNSAAPPNGAPEGMAPSAVNNVQRENMKAVRDWYIDPAWIDFGYTYAYVDTTNFKIAGTDVSADYPIGRRVRAIGSTTGTIYGTITNVAFSTDTTVTVAWDSGTISNETLAISVGLPTLGKPIPYAALGLTGLIALADMANLAADTVIGRANGAGTGVPQALSQAQQRVILGLATSAYETVESVRLVPQNSKSAAYTTVLSDGGKHILHPSADTTPRTFTIDSNANVAYPLGTAITFINQNSAGVVTIAITSDTMRLAGTGATGSRTLAANGVATAVKITTTEWIISGTGLS